MGRMYEQSDHSPFKFKSLKLYGSTEWLVENKKKYRQVYDRFELSYIYAELAFYNKYFDKANWELDVNLKCYQLGKRKKQLCNIKVNKKVSKYDNIVYVREGWGHKKKGQFWKTGSYYWEAWIGDQKMATKYFYVEDAGTNLSEDNKPYLSIDAIRLYEGQYDDDVANEKIYMKSFDEHSTRYIYTEIAFTNHYKKKDWHCEMFVKFFNEARELKGHITKLFNVTKNEENLTITAGWGTNVEGSWREGLYTVEIIFMESLLAECTFEVGDENIEGNPEVAIYSNGQKSVLIPDKLAKISFEELMLDLESLIGLESIKKQVRDHAQYIKFLQLRKAKGFLELEPINVHSIFMGNPGTGKTTIAQKMGWLYCKMGLISKGHVHEVSRVDLVGEYIGQTAPKVKEAIEKARGGVLFIDEAYALARSNDDNKDFGREVIEILVKEMSNGKGDLVIIAAGYPKEMENFIDSNPGLRSRFKLKFHFDDYTPPELFKIAKYSASNQEVTLSPAAEVAINDIIMNAYRKRDKSFGNARYVYDLIEKAKINLGLRIMNRKNPNKLTKEKLSVIELTDINNFNNNVPTIDLDIPIDEIELANTLKELHELVGIVDVKKRIVELIEIVRYHRAIGSSVLHQFGLHTVFIGNPGTGKTTVARILTRIYKSLGILSRGHIVETDRQGLVAGFVGQTAIKTNERIEEALGGILFIDEAYALTNTRGVNADYGHEAIQTLLKRMEDNRGEFFVFTAGYPDNMEGFLKMNPGLKSRFDQTLIFPDYSPQELSEIAYRMSQEMGYHWTQKAMEKLELMLQKMFEQRDPFFGNARSIRTLVEEVIKVQNLRMAAKLSNNQRLSKSNKQIVYSDLIEVISRERETGVLQRTKIGF